MMNKSLAIDEDDVTLIQTSAYINKRKKKRNLHANLFDANIPKTVEFSAFHNIFYRINKKTKYCAQYSMSSKHNLMVFSHKFRISFPFTFRLNYLLSYWQLNVNTQKNCTRLRIRKITINWKREKNVGSKEVVQKDEIRWDGCSTYMLWLIKKFTY